MDIDLAGVPGLALRIEANSLGRGSYPTARLQKGFLLVYNGEELAEEAVGFGVPVLKRGLQAIFPGGIELTARGRGQSGRGLPSSRCAWKKGSTGAGAGA